MITIKRVVTDLGKTEYNGELLDSHRVDWMYDGLAVCIQLSGETFYVQGKETRLWISKPYVKGSDFSGPRLLINSLDGYNIETVKSVTRGIGLLADDTYKSVDVFTIDENTDAVNIFGITRPVHKEDGTFLWNEQIMLRTYLEEKNVIQPKASSGEKDSNDHPEQAVE